MSCIPSTILYTPKKPPRERRTTRLGRRWVRFLNAANHQFDAVQSEVGLARLDVGIARLAGAADQPPNQCSARFAKLARLSPRLTKPAAHERSESQW